MLSPEEWSVIALSLKVAVVAIAIALPVAILVAYKLARRSMPWSFVIENLIQLPLVLPPVVTGFALLVLLGPGSAFGRLTETLGVSVAFTWFGAVLAAAVVAFPLLVQTLRATFEQIDPEWEEAASVYGGSRWSIFRYVTAPLAARGVFAATILGFARALGEFGATIVVAGNIPGSTRTLPLAIYTSVNQLGGGSSALRLIGASVVLSVLSLVIYSVLSKKLFSHD